MAKVTENETLPLPTDTMFLIYNRYSEDRRKEKADAKSSIRDIDLAKEDLVMNSSDDDQDYAPHTKKPRLSKEESDGSVLENGQEVQIPKSEYGQEAEDIQHANSKDFKAKNPHFTETLKTVEAQHPSDDQQQSFQKQQFPNNKDFKGIVVKGINEPAWEIFDHICQERICDRDDGHWLVAVRDPEEESEDLFGYYCDIVSCTLNMPREEAKDRIYLVAGRGCCGFCLRLNLEMSDRLKKSSHVIDVMRDCLWDRREEATGDCISEKQDEVVSVGPLDLEYGSDPWSLDFPYMRFLDDVSEDDHVINGKQVESKPSITTLSVSSKDIKTKKIFVGGIPTSVTEEEFRDIFAKYGKVKEHMIIRDHFTGRSRGFGFITFDTEESVDNILSNGNRIELSGAQVEIKKAEPKKGSGIPPSQKLFGYSRPAYCGYGPIRSGVGPSSYKADGGRPGGYGGSGFSNVYGVGGGYGGGYNRVEPKSLGYSSSYGGSYSRGYNLAVGGGAYGEGYRGYEGAVGDSCLGLGGHDGCARGSYYGSTGAYAAGPGPLSWFW